MGAGAGVGVELVGLKERAASAPVVPSTTPSPAAGGFTAFTLSSYRQRYERGREAENESLPNPWGATNFSWLPYNGVSWGLQKRIYVKFNYFEGEMGDWSWRRLLSWIGQSLPFLGMVATVVSLSLYMTISKKAMSNGTSFYVLSAYSHAMASVILVPCGYLFHRSKLPPLTFSILWRIFLVAVFGCIGDIASNAGIKKSSATLGSEILNLVPGFTYLLAIIFRMEEFNLGRVSDIAKSLGTVALIAGASIVTLYRGPAIWNKGFREDSFKVVPSSQQDWVFGGILLSTAALSVASWNILQASIVKIYPAEMMITAIYSVLVTLLSTLATLAAERDFSAWKLQSEMGLAAVLYAGIINIPVRIYVATWCLTKRGPLFVSLFNPLTIVVSAFLGVVFVHEVLYSGSLAGTALLVIGFYAVMWGKAQDSRRNEVSVVAPGEEAASSGVPLLQDDIEEEA